MNTTREKEHWVGTWATTPAPTEGAVIKGQTIRIIARVSIGGNKIRVRLSNAYGNHKLTIGAATVALRGSGSEIIRGSDQQLTFNGKLTTKIAVGAIALSDPIDFKLPPLTDAAVSVYLPDDIGEDFKITGHGTSRQTNYISPKGNHSSEIDMPVKEETETNFFVTGIDVLAQEQTGGIVTLGDSLTDCNISSIDANQRWPDQLARRLVKRHQTKNGRLLGVMNQGIGGNRILHDIRGDSCLRRFDRDVIAQPGVTHVIVFLGINDIRNRNCNPDEEVSAEQMICGLNQLAMRGHSAGLKMICGTLLTFENENYNPPPGRTGLFTEEGGKKRQIVNNWIRENSDYDGVIDFELALRAPDHPTQMLPEFDCGDHLHPNDKGYLRMGDAIDLGLFD